MKRIILCFFLLVYCFSCMSSVAEDSLPENSVIYNTDEGYMVGYVPILSIPVKELPCPPLDDTILTDDPDTLLVMQTCRQVFSEKTAQEGSDDQEHSVITFYNPYIFLAEEKDDIKKYYFALDINSYSMCELENGQLVLYNTEGEFTQSILTFRVTDEGYEYISYEEPKDTFLPGTVNQLVDGYYSGLTDEMWEEMSDAGYADGYPLELIKKYLKFNELYQVFIII